MGRTGQALQFGLTKGRWPVKSINIVLGLLKNAMANAEAKKLDVDNYNNKVVDILKKSSRFLKIPLEKYMPKDPDGVSRIIGKFELNET